MSEDYRMKSYKVIVFVALGSSRRKLESRSMPSRRRRISRLLEGSPSEVADSWRLKAVWLDKVQGALQSWSLELLDLHRFACLCCPASSS